MAEASEPAPPTVARPRTPVLLVHGMWCTGDDWQRVRQLLNARGFDCHAPTLPAHQPTPDQPLQVGALGLQDYLRFLKAEIAARDWSVPPVIIGHSMGGVLAQQLAASVPCRAMVLLTPALPWGMNILAWSNFKAFFRAFARWGFWRKPHKPSRAMAGWCAFNGVPEARHDRMYERMVHESGRAAFELAFWWADLSRGARADARAIQCPTYIVSAGQDRLTPSRHVRKLARRYPWAQLRHYPDRGHWVIDDEQTDEMMNGICSWLRPIEVRTAPPTDAPQERRA
ncbi:alpha/beta hydrolase [Flagellatimonas centrodinii]|uniref:alpha/beta hydrolase n=1 Tax=Flagellatimonas centrodinii TaxID=2806210 RepID=UPI001FEF3DA4|nr:alpha/beta fold hydrolase [Flagellatimonas centrodinii]ULQ45665.1 alpha/beta hydrolase [Flagellatimonas centrodinii]